MNGEFVVSQLIDEPIARAGGHKRNELPPGMIITRWKTNSRQAAAAARAARARAKLASAASSETAA